MSEKEEKPKSSFTKRMERAREEKAKYIKAREERLAQKEKIKMQAPKKNVTKVLVLFVFAFLILGAMYMFNENNDAFEAKSKAKQKQIASLEQQLNAFDLEKVSEKQAASQLYNASKAGSEVAKLQNKYCEKGAITDLDLVQSTAKGLDPYFDKDSVNSRTPWFVVSKPEVLRDDSYEYGWVFKSTADFTGKETQVVWINQDNSGKVLAYATGVYNVDTGKFSKMSVTQTLYGVTKLDVN